MSPALPPPGCLFQRSKSVRFRSFDRSCLAAGSYLRRSDGEGGAAAAARPALCAVPGRSHSGRVQGDARSAGAATPQQHAQGPSFPPATAKTRPVRCASWPDDPNEIMRPCSKFHVAKRPECSTPLMLSVRDHPFGLHRTPGSISSCFRARAPRACPRASASRRRQPSARSVRRAQQQRRDPATHSLPAALVSSCFFH